MKRRIDKVARSQSKDKESAAGGLQGCYRQRLDHSRMMVERALDSYEQVEALNTLAPPRIRRLNEELASEDFKGTSSQKRSRTFTDKSPPPTPFVKGEVGGRRLLSPFEKGGRGDFVPHRTASVP